MSTSIDTAFVKQYEAEVHEAYQRMGSKLRPWTRTKMITNAKDTTFQIVGRGTAATKGRHALVPTMNQSHTNVTCTLVDYYAGDWIDKLDELKTNIDERSVVANGGAYALGRQTDSLIITALGTASTSSVTMATTSAAAFLAKQLEAVEALNALDVPDDGQRYAAVAPRHWSWLMLIKEFASSDFVGDRPYGGMQMKTWLGVNWMTHTGLAKSSNNRTSLLWHRSAIGHGIGADVQVDITWHGDRAAWFVNHMMSQGSVLIDSEGVVKMVLDESAALAQ